MAKNVTHADNLTPNPFPSGKGDRMQWSPFARGKGDRMEGSVARAPRLSGAGRRARVLPIGAVATYRAVVSPLIHAINGPACRYEPSCSVYARDAIAEYGIVRGGAMALWRVARCNPLGGHGFDPVRRHGVQGE
jgi:putative membrane protein insertion efficiency factor